MIEPHTLVNAKLYPNEDAVIQDALRSLLVEKPQLRVELAIYRYQTEDISVAKAAHLTGMSFDQMKALLVQRGAQLRLGPADDAEARQEIADMQRVLADRKPRLAAEALQIRHRSLVRLGQTEQQMDFVNEQHPKIAVHLYSPTLLSSSFRARRLLFCCRISAMRACHVLSSPKR